MSSARAAYTSPVPTGPTLGMMTLAPADANSNPISNPKQGQGAHDLTGAMALLAGFAARPRRAGAEPAARASW